MKNTMHYSQDRRFWNIKDYDGNMWAVSADNTLMNMIECTHLPEIMECIRKYLKDIELDNELEVGIRYDMNANIYRNIYVDYLGMDIHGGRYIYINTDLNNVNSYYPSCNIINPTKFNRVYESIRVKKNREYELYFKSYTITKQECFNGLSVNECMKLFDSCILNFRFSEIQYTISNHSLFGEAYINAVKRRMKYKENKSVIHPDASKFTPEYDIVKDEFEKLIIKLVHRGCALDI